MDILALISTPIPAYFTLGPLIVLLIILSALVKKSSSGTMPQATATATAPAQVTSTPVAPQVERPVAAPVVEVPKPVEAAIPPISSWKPAEPVAMPQEAPTPITQAPPQVMETPQVANVPVSTPAAEPAKPTF